MSRPRQERSRATSGGEPRSERTDDAGPLLRVVRGLPDPAELAALIAVVAALGTPAPAPRPARSAWAEPASVLRPVPPAGRGGWRASALPR